MQAEEVSTEETTTQLRWAEVPGATGYLLEIKNSSGYTVISERTEVPYYILKNFISGRYEHRVGVINKFGKVGSFSEWVSFEVVVSRIPTLTKDLVYSISKEEKTKTFQLEGKDFLPDMKVFMILEGRKIPAKSVIVDPPNSAKAVFDIESGMETGIYDLVLENPRKKTLNAKQRIVLSESKEKAQRFAERQERILKKEIPEDYYETPYWSTLWRASVLPGWGQNYIEGSRWKLIAYPLIAVGIAGAYSSSYNQFLSAKSNYESASLLGFFLSESQDTQLLWLLNRNSAESSYSQAKQELNGIRAGIGALAAFALYNLVDAYFSARRNVASATMPDPGFALGSEYLRMDVKVESQAKLNPMRGNEIFSQDPRYSLEIQYRF
ncbi:hypothetical protein LPTSP4_07240 [Leptospira ryugenii]|uniref:DUF5683 domain-containing protein n=1 Tax=Leptospira ryugenii TaxID=1917863 RepID=A0A2P2DX55_9LEPT|nr:hypothetical protein LPTSP4_07240 [Leptospira ryugenii]